MAISTSNRKILVVDDEEKIVELISEILTQRNYHPIGAVRWTDALDAISNGSPDLILLDLKMPTIHGSSMLEFIREEGIDIPVIVVSGFITEEVTQELSGIGVSGFIGKPFQASQLIVEIERVLGKPETPEAPASSAPSLQESDGEAADKVSASTDDLHQQPSEPSGATDDRLQEVDAEAPVTMDALYDRLSGPPSGPSGETADAQSVQTWLQEAGDAPGMDVLYRLSAGDAPVAGSLPNAPPTDEEVLQILQRRNATGHARPALAESGATEAGATAEGNGENQAAREVLRALGKLDGEKQAARPDQTQTTGPLAGAARGSGAPPGALSSRQPRPSTPPSLNRTDAATEPDHPPGASGSPPPSPLSGPAPQELFPERQRSSGHSYSRRPRRSGSSTIYVVLTVICVLVAGGMVVLKMLTSRLSKTIDETKASLEKSAIEQIKKDAMKEYGQELKKGK